MSDWPIINDGYSLMSSYTGVSTSASANTKGSWTELITATEATSILDLTIMQQYGSRALLYDIGIGASGSEEVIVANLLSWSGTDLYNRQMGHYVPLSMIIQKGTRVSCRAQCTTGSSTHYVVTTTKPLNFMTAGGYSICETAGANTSDSGGVAVTPGVGSMGSWYQISSGIGREARAFYIGVGAGSDWARVYNDIYFDIGLTSSPGDMIILNNYRIFCHSYGQTIEPHFSPIFKMIIPAGEEIHARCNYGTASDGAPDLIFYLLS